MVPLSGFIERSGRGIIRIRLDTGGVLEAPSQPDLDRGDKVEVDFDYTKNKVGTVWKVGKRPSFEEPADDEHEDLDDNKTSECIDELVPLSFTHGHEGSEDTQDLSSLPLGDRAGDKGASVDIDTDGDIDELDFQSHINLLL